MMKLGGVVMKPITILISVCFFLAGGSIVSGQSQAPPGAGDKNLSDRNIKDRSIELERVSRDMKKTSPASKEDQERQFLEIKQDFERIQLSQSEIVDGYTKAKTVDYEKISENAEKVNVGGKRLLGNLFPPTEQKKGDKKVERLAEPMPTDVKTLIVDLDSAIGAFTANPMFTNPQVVSVEDSKKGKAELEKIIGVSSALKKESDKLKKQ
jgi:hypothetical protein